jgi:hypothetical protein
MSVRKSNLVAGLVVTVVSIGTASAQGANSGEVRHVMPRLQVVRDADSGQLRAPMHEEVAAMARASAAAAPAQTGQQRSGAGAAKEHSLTPADHPMVLAEQAPLPQARLGAKARRFDMERMPFSVARKGVDGTLDTACVVGEQAAVKALTGSAEVAAVAKAGHRHAH